MGAARGTRQVNMEEVLGMASQIEEEGGGARHTPIDPERVAKIFEINNTLDAMIARVGALLTGAVQSLPTGVTKIAFMNKLLVLVATMDEEVRKEVSGGNSKRV